MKNTFLLFCLLANLPLHGQDEPPSIVNAAKHEAKADFDLSVFMQNFYFKDNTARQSYQSHYTQLLTFTEDLAKEKKNYKSDKKFLKAVFEKTHRRFLKKYELCSTLTEVFEDGKYDCVSGTALLALVVSVLDFQYTIKETPFHAYLLVESAEGTILLESTDRVYGFIPNKSLVKKYEEIYTKLHIDPKDKNAIVFNKAVNLEQLAGLQFYNEAILNFNQRNFEIAKTQLKHALSLYTADRIVALMELSEQFSVNYAQK
jgi:hypothetical protein